MIVGDEGEAVEEERYVWVVTVRRCVRKEEAEFRADIIVRAVVGGRNVAPVVDAYFAVERTSWREEGVDLRRSA